MEYFYTRRINETTNSRECLEILLVEELFDLKKQHHFKLLEYCQHILDDCIEVTELFNKYQYIFSRLIIICPEPT